MRCLELRVFVWALRKQGIRYIVSAHYDREIWTLKRFIAEELKAYNYLSAIHGVFVQNGNYHLKNLSERVFFWSAAHAGLTNGLGLLLEQLRILAAAQSTKFSPEKFLKLASDGNDKLVLQMVKGEPNLVSYAKYPLKKISKIYDEKKIRTIENHQRTLYFFFCY